MSARNIFLQARDNGGQSCLSAKADGNEGGAFGGFW